MKIAVTGCITLVVTLVLVGVVALGLKARGGLAKPDVQKVRVEHPIRGDLTECVSAQAEVQPRTKVAISARVSARILELAFDEGDKVTKGDPHADPPVAPSVLVRLDAAELEAALASAEAQRAAQAAQIEVEKARIAGQRAGIAGTAASLSQARRDMERQESLLGSGDVSQSTVDSIRCSVDELTAQLDAADHSLKAAELNLIVLKHRLDAADAEITRARDSLTYTTITSTIDGVVTRVRAEAGELVIPGTMNNPGTVIMEVADLSQMLLVAQVDEGDIGRIREGQRALARVQTCPDDIVEGTVDSIALVHDVGSAGAKYYKTEILLKLAGERVYCGSTADVEIEAERHRDVLKLPSQAVLERTVEDLPMAIRDGDENVDPSKTYATVVYRLVDGKAVVTPVRIGPSDETHTVIASGIGEDDSVIVGPYKVLEGIAHEQNVQDERETADEAEGDGNGPDDAADDAPDKG
jgi:HlyD family secretion protein